MEHISIKEIGQIIKQNRFWLGIIGLLDLLSILLLWLIDAQAFQVIAISVILFSLLVFVTAVLYLAKKERKRKKAFDEFLAVPDSYHEEQLFHDAENLQAEIRSFSQILHEQMDQCAQSPVTPVDQTLQNAPYPRISPQTSASSAPYNDPHRSHQNRHFPPARYNHPHPANADLHPAEVRASS